LNRRRPPRRAPESRAPRKAAQPLQPSTDVPDIQSFREWPLADAVQEAIAAMGITTPTPIQRLSIGPALQGKDMIAKAETGTGKTLAFGAPMMSRIESGRASVLGLVLCPTRELAQQVAGVLEKLGSARGVKVALVVGGEPMPPQIDALKAGAQVVVGTPGRVIDLYGQRFLSFPWTEFVVLDEADQMLEIGFIDDVRKILSYTPDERQTMLFSATFPDEVLRLAREATREPVEVATAAGLATVKTIDQSWVLVPRTDRSLVLTRLIEQSAADDVFLVFCDRRTEVDTLMRQLERLPFSVKALHGGFDQASRFRVMSAFRTGEVKALVATDVASRGLDVHLVSHVVNYGVPHDVEDYTHRIGRTGRAGRSGTAITLISPEQLTRWKGLMRQAKWEIAEIEAPRRTGRATPARPAFERPEPRPEGERERAREPRRHEASRDEMRQETRQREPRRDERREPARREAPPRRPEPRREPAERLGAGGPPSADRPKRELSTRERLRLEREGAQGTNEGGPSSNTGESGAPGRRRRRGRGRPSGAQPERE
jgi:superfamily II DNA/RNA helicase